MPLIKSARIGKGLSMDTILIRGLRVFAYHGVNPEEKRDGQTFVLDLDLSLDLSRPCRSDRVEDTVSYAQVRKTVERVMTEKKYNLIERAAQAVADAVLDEYSAVEQLDVTLCKPDAPMKGDFDTVGVRIQRGRQG